MRANYRFRQGNDSQSMHFAGGVRIVAIVEAAKGVLILLAGFSLLTLVHRQAQEVAEELVGHLHLNPANRYPRIFIDLAGRLTDGRLWVLAGLAMTYAIIRFIEAYGLWRERRWAEWFAVASSAMYVPIELYELFAGVSPLKVIAFTVNVGVVVYMSAVLWRAQVGNESTLS
jgi:uncharacterized membrane protein (DUF2068 family)